MNTLALKIGVLALLYAVTGKLGLALAIPPGYATAIFPPAGVALAALLLFGAPILPGIWLGSLLLNLWAAHDNFGSLSMLAVTNAAAIASGATLQALVGEKLIRRWCRPGWALKNVREIGALFALGGPLACLTNASLATVTLYLRDVISIDQCAYIWFTWWVGDTIGVLIALPIAFCLGVDLPIWRLRRLTVTIPLLLSMAIVVALFYRVNASEVGARQFEFTNAALREFEALKVNLSRLTANNEALQGYFAASDDMISGDEFAVFTSYLALEPGMWMMAWVPLVDAQLRPSYEANPPYPHVHQRITEVDENGGFVTAGERGEYAPFHYVSPLAGHESLVGFDLISEAVRRTALMRALEGKKTVVTAPVYLVQTDRKRIGVLLFSPAAVGAGLAGDADKLVTSKYDGVVASVVDVADAITRGLNITAASKIVVTLRDVTQPNAEKLLYGETNSSSPSMEPGWILAQDLIFGERIWRFEARPSEAFLGARGWQAWSVLAIGLLMVSVAGIFLLTVTGHTARVERAVREKTAELNAANQSTVRTNAQLQAILDNAPEAIITLNEQFVILDANKAAESLLQSSSINGELLRKFLVVEGELEGADFWMPMLNAKHEFLIKPVLGAPVSVELSLTPVRTPDRLVYTVIAHDLTNQKRNERLKDEFISTVSHELRTPLTAIRGGLGLIAAGVLGSLPQAVQPIMQMALINVERLSRLINDILDLSKLEAGAMEMKLSHQPLRPALVEAVETNRGISASARVTLELEENAAADACVHVDRDRFIQVVTNLLSNAIKFSPEGGTVRVTTTVRDDWVRVSVRDQGPGVPEEFRSRIFHRFAQAQSTSNRRYAGSGLGLSIAKALVNQMGGELDFVSSPSDGSTFFFELPIV